VPVTGTAPWPAPTATGPIEARVSVPASKSLMARALVLAALADEPTVLHNPLVARDSLLMARALSALGSTVSTPDDGPWRVVPGLAAADAAVDCGLSGTVMRFVPPLAGLGRSLVTFDGDPRARERPMRGLLDALRALGVQVRPDQAATLPFAVRGTGGVRGGSVSVDAGESSQFVSGLLLAGCRFDLGLHLDATAAPPSIPHITMTLHALRARGVPAAALGPAAWQVASVAPRGGEVTIEPDLTNAAPFLAAALVAGGRVEVPGWPLESTQPGRRLLELLSGLGATTALEATGVASVVGGRLRGLGHVDLRDVGELVPTVAALAALADSPTTITGVAHLRGHETDRLACLTAALRTLGARAWQTDDGLHVEPGRLHAGTVATEGDHRMATFAALIGLAVPGVCVDDIAVTTKTMPDFPARWQAMLG